MDLKFLNLNSLSLYNFLFISLGILSLILIFWVFRLERKMRKLLRGKNGSLESIITDNHREIKELKNFQKETLNKLNDIQNRLKRSIQAIETIKFNPFKGVGVGGNQSFSSAFLNEEGNGLVISGLYLRDRFSVYAKPIKGYSGELELSDEEQETINRAKNKIQGS